MVDYTAQDFKNCYTGFLKLSEQGKTWTECWAVLNSDALRLYTNQENFFSGSEETRLIRLSSKTQCQSVQSSNSSSNFHFKICVGSSVYRFKCASEFLRDQWLSRVNSVIGSQCQKACFHCYEMDNNANGKPPFSSSTSEHQSISSVSSCELGSPTEDSLPYKNISDTTRSGGEPKRKDQVTSPSLKIFGFEETIFSSFSGMSRETKSQNEADVRGRTFSSQDTEHLKNSFAVAEQNEDEGGNYLLPANTADQETKPEDQVLTSPLKVFDTQNNLFSTFSKRLSLKKRPPSGGFGNPAFVSDDVDTNPEIPNRISKHFDAPLNYDVPSLSKGKSDCGSLKVLTGKKWKKYHATIHGSQLLLTNEDELKNNDNTEVMRIDLKPTLHFQLLPRRNNDYRFKMTLSPSSEYFFKSPTVFQRDQWIEALMVASRSVCQGACARCCQGDTRESFLRTRADLNPEHDGTGRTEVVDLDECQDNVFYVRTKREAAAITSGDHGANQESPDSATTKNTENLSCSDDRVLHSGYLKTDALEKKWKRYWCVIRTDKLLLYSNEHDAKEVKAIALSGNVQCRTAKRKSDSFRFTLIVGAAASYEFKCSSAQERQQWLKSLEREWLSGASISEQGRTVDGEKDATEGDVEGTEIGAMKTDETEEQPQQQLRQQQRSQMLQQLKLQQQQQQEQHGEALYENVLSNDTGVLPQPQQQHEQQQQQQQQQQLGEQFYETIPTTDTTVQEPNRQQQLQHNEEALRETIPITDDETENRPSYGHDINQVHSLWNFEEHVTIYQVTKDEGKIVASGDEESKTAAEISGTEEGDQSRVGNLRQEQQSRVEPVQGTAVQDTEKAEKIEKTHGQCSSSMKELRESRGFAGPADSTLELGVQDTERFITDVLGKINLPPEINKQRLELSERLRKLLSKTDGVKKKSLRREPSFYDDVMTEVKSLHAEEEQGVGQETYDDVAPGTGTKDEVEGHPEEMYDDVKADSVSKESEEKSPEQKTESNTITEEMYDDVATAANTSVSDNEPSREVYDDVAAISNNTEPAPEKSDKISQHSLGSIGEPKKASEIKHKLCDGYLQKYGKKAIIKLSKWQRRYCILTPLALYYYADPKDSKQKGTIVLPSSGCTLHSESPNHPDVKDNKLCFELGSSERWYLFKAEKQADYDKWIENIRSALKTELSEEQSCLIRSTSIKIARNEKEDEVSFADAAGEDFYEPVDSYRKNASSSSNDTEAVEGEMYEETEQLSGKENSSGSAGEAPALPSRRKPAQKESEAFIQEDYELPGVKAKPEIKELTAEEEEKEEMIKENRQSNVDAKPPSLPSRNNQLPLESPKLPQRPSSSQDAPKLPPRTGTPADGQATQQPPALPARTSPPTPKKAPPASPKTSVLEEVKPAFPLPSKKEPEITLEEKPKETTEKKPEVVPSPKKVTPPSTLKTKPGEQFDYARVYVAMWNCEADDEDDLAFSRGNQLYIREKIPNSDWWVASLMDSPDIQVGLVPRNYIMPAYQL